MKFYNLLIKYRLPLGILALVLAILVHINSGFWPSFILYLLALVAIVTHFIIGPMRLLQEPMEQGNFEEAKKVLDSIKFPGLLIKPIRSTYFQMQSYLSMMDKDNDKAEALMKKSLSLGSPMKETEGASYLQLGSLAMQKNNLKQAEEYLRMAMKSGLPDKESKAMALMQLVNIYIQKRQYRAAKEHFKRAKELKPTSPELVQQIKLMDKNISRMPG
jgi:tetratricopeptide (TPR) repeat protein